MVKEGKTPILSAEVARKLLDSIPTDSLQGLRDRVQTSETMIDLAVIRDPGLKAGQPFRSGRFSNGRIASACRDSSSISGGVLI